MDSAQKPAVQEHQRWEQDERWTAVDEYAIASLSHRGPPDEAKLLSALEYAKELSSETSLPNAEVSHLQGRFLRLQCMMLNAKNILEVGTLSGYSAIWLASTFLETKVTTIELEQWNKEIAQRAIENAGMGDRIEVLLGAGKDVLPQVRNAVEVGEREKFDFVFIDADKHNSLLYLNEAIPLCRPRALIVVDNVVRKGALANVEVAKTDEKVAGSRAVVETAGRDGRLECTLMQTVGEKNYDGFLLCLVK